MKQVLQNRKMGKASVVDVPVPVLQHGRVLVRTAASLISAGTERAATESVRKGLVTEARERPDLVRSVIERVRTDGLRTTIEKVREKLAMSQPLGYSASGIVIEVAPDVTGFRVGDRVACAGLGFASHAEVLSVPKNLCVHLPNKVDFPQGAFGTVGAIALQGVRLAEPRLAESVAVIGLGLIGQLTVQLLKANGCRVFGIDLDDKRVELSKRLGAEAGCISGDNARDEVLSWSRGRGADAVIITAATESNQPIVLAGEISRMKGRVVVVGQTGMEIPRDLFYRRELSLHLSMSYGPGRYDPDYEERGNDYPFAYVRWTENRNIEAFLDLLASNAVDVNPLITHRFSIDQAEKAYDVIAGENRDPHLAVLLEYDTQREIRTDVELSPERVRVLQSSVRLGVVGAGNYTRSMLLPHFKAAGAEFFSITTASGVSAIDVGRKFEFRRSVAGADEVLADKDVNLILIGTRHDSHADLTTRALAAGHNVFVEKPLALNDEELQRVLEVARTASGALMVGFNRRFSPLAIAGKEFFEQRTTPLSILYRVNAGRIARDHWIQDPDQGGRIIGEACHAIDLMQFWIGAPPVSVFVVPVRGNSHAVVDADSVFITLQFADGSNGCVAYLAEGDKGLGKERVEIFGSGKVFVLDDFRSATFSEKGTARTKTLRAQDKGQQEQARRVCEAVRSGTSLYTLEELAATARATFRAIDSLRSGSVENI
jgi:polar amino acid transport system substrate-binding protein